MSPTSGASNSSNSPRNGSPRRVFVTIHENEERVTTRLVEPSDPPNLGENNLTSNGSKHESSPTPISGATQITT